MFDKVTTDMDIYKKEIFGPVLCQMSAPKPMKKPSEAMPWINEYGNGTAIFTAVTVTLRATLPTASISAWSASTVPIPVPLRLPHLRRLEESPALVI